MDKASNICLAMKKLQKEQRILSEMDIDFQFICSLQKFDTIPFMLFTNDSQKPFSAFFNCIKTSFFRLEKLDEETCCALLTLLEPVDMDGCPVDSHEDVFSLRKTKECIIVVLNCFCAINPLPLALVNKPLPIIEPKC
ncbi:CotY/CotZ family spore coat protein [Viridibacillus sp. NPDC093762]|uniref:CotY/CotZ family spore coat protein n=1 Tax=Viridibacillus sp. NPDC093762 TaxID=3390720 RepID=UPI003D02E239